MLTERTANQTPEQIRPAHVDPGGERRAPDAFEDSLIPGVGHPDRQVAERGRHRGEHGHGRGEELGEAVAATHLFISEDDAEQDQEDDRESQSEEGGGRRAPEQAVVVAELSPEERRVAGAAHDA